VADYAELSLMTRVFLAAYRWRRIDPIPWSPLRKALAASKVGIVSTAGLGLPDQSHFDEGVRGGDYSYRVIPSDADLTTLIDTHRSDTYDHSGVQSDANLVLPIDRLRELARDGRIGAVAERHLSFMGSITAPGRLTTETAPAAAQLFVEDHVDVALLVPV
jgi:D-proline reductase (dithiol) PrdB